MADIEDDLDLGPELAALFASDLPPAHDAGFLVAVSRRVARRRLMLELARLAVGSALLALVLWAVAPVLAPMVKPFASPLLVLTPVLAVVAGVLVLAHPRAVV